jgi:hypothetical protein
MTQVGMVVHQRAHSECGWLQKVRGIPVEMRALTDGMMTRAEIS